MSVGGKKGVGLPTILLHEGEAHIITVELKTGATYRGELVQSEDSWNLLLKDVTVTTREGKVHTLTTIYLRGNQIRFIILPDMLANAPMFERVRAFKKGITVPGSTVRGVPPPTQGSYIGFDMLLLLSHDILICCFVQRLQVEVIAVECEAVCEEVADTFRKPRNC